MIGRSFRDLHLGSQKAKRSRFWDCKFLRGIVIGRNYPGSLRSVRGPRLHMRTCRSWAGMFLRNRESVMRHHHQLRNDRGPKECSRQMSLTPYSDCRIPPNMASVMAARYPPHSGRVLHPNMKSSPPLADMTLNYTESVRWMHWMGHSFQDWSRYTISCEFLVDMYPRYKPIETMTLPWVRNARVLYQSRPLHHLTPFGGCMFRLHRESVC